MSLVPAVTDPNRKNELQRAKEDPKAFDADPGHNRTGSPEFNTQGSGLVADRDKPTTDAAKSTPTEAELVAEEEAKRMAAEEAEAVRKQWLDYLDRSVADITAELADIDVEQLAAMQVVEAETKSRKTLIEAMAEEIAARNQGE